MRALPYIAFLLSGASSLIFQVIWSRMLHHVFGATSVAVSSVVTAFMIGLGLGAWITGRFADRIRHPIVTYALAELVVGSWALLLPSLLRADGWLATVNHALRASLGPESFGFTVARFLCVLPILLVPTTLMGSTLPLLARHFVDAEQRAGRASAQVGALYALNTLGAVLGTFLAGFVLLPAVGLAATNAVALSLNFLLGLGILALRRPLLAGRWRPGEPLRWWPERDPAPGAPVAAGAPAPEAPGGPAAADPPVGDEGEPAADAAPTWFPPVARWAAFGAFAVSGATALAYEVVWTRSLAMVIGSSTYSFSLILMTFLLGIAGGSALAAALATRDRSPAVTLASYAAGITLLANAPLGTKEGPLTWAVASGFFVAVVVAVAFVARALERGGALVSPSRGLGAALGTLAVPVAAATLNAVLVEGVLPGIVATVVALLAAFGALPLVGRRAPVLFLALVQLFVAVAAFANYLFQDEIPFAFAQMVGAMGERASGDVPLVQTMMFVTSGLCVLPVTLGTGAMFPATLRIWSAGGERVGRDVGVVYAGNTAGSIVGAWLPGFVLMPWIGMERTLHVAIVLNLGLALALLLVGGADAAPGTVPADGEDAPRRVPFWHVATTYALAPAVPALVALLVVGTSRVGLFGADLRWNLGHMTLGVFRMSLTDDVLDPETWGQPEIPYYRDGLVTTVTVEKWGHHLAMKNNGKVDASNGDDMPTQIMVAGFPLLLHPDGPEGLDVAVVGFGSGVTVGSTLQFPVERVDVVELEPRILEASRLFADVNHLRYPLEGFPWVEMPRLQVVNDDGRNYLASTDRRYDVIISEPSNPWIAGVADLFTTDHFRITKRRLREGGVYCQWVQLYELSPENIKTIYRTFASEFAHAMVFSADDLSSDTVMIGSDAPLTLDLARMQRAFAEPAVAAELDRADVHGPYDAIARVLLADRDEILAYARVEERREGGDWVRDVASPNDPGVPCEPPGCRRVPAPVNTDDNARIEFAAPRDLIGYAEFAGYVDSVYGPAWPWGRLGERVTGLGDGGVAEADAWAELALSLAAHGRKSRAETFLRRAAEAGPSRTTLVAAQVLALLLGDDRAPPVAVAPPDPGPEMDARSRKLLLEGFATVRRLVDDGRWEDALAAIEAIPAPLRLHAGPSTRLLHAYLLYRSAPLVPGRFGEAVDQLEELVRHEEPFADRHPELWYYLARAQDAEGRFDEALDSMRTYVERAGLVRDS